MADWEAQFPRYDAEHPDIWTLFEKYTLDMIAAGHKQVGHGLIFGRIRYDAALKKQQGSTFKLNQNYGAYYARKFMKLYPQHEDLFSTRTIRGHDIFEEERV
ncbi:MAG: hypothetical protein B7Z40_19345 [Bosea sp. 12-68-7]|nr:MAG: hypothetical protein B7Z40_19345 [Bosea sp. 12-68-7]